MIQIIIIFIGFNTFSLIRFALIQTNLVEDSLIRNIIFYLLQAILWIIGIIGL